MNDLFLAIGVIDPQAADRLAPVGAQQPGERQVAGVDEGDGILAGEGIEPEGHGTWRRGAAMGRQQHRRIRQGARSALRSPCPGG